MLERLAAIVLSIVVALSLSERLIYDFPDNWLHGGLPSAGLVQGDGGAMYGTTAFGGTGRCNDLYPGCGTAYKLTQRQGRFYQTVIYDFRGKEDGFEPDSIVRDRLGVFYGLAHNDRNRPTLFRIAPSGSAYSETTLFRFPNIQLPSGQLTIGPDGSLYGADISFSTQHQLTYGMIFRFTLTDVGASERILYNFLTVSEGVSPRAPLLIDKKGAIYGATAFGGTTQGTDCVSRGCGTIFKLTPSASGYTLETLYRFTGGMDGYLPSALIADASGNLYGATSFGGYKCPFNTCGTVFEFDVATRTHKVLCYFKKSGLWYPGGDPLTFDTTGAIYGTTAEYGAGNQFGGIFKLAPTSSGFVESVAHVFAGSPADGNSPTGGLLLAPSGNALYGATYWGGNGIGTAFELNIR